ncbi:MAG: NAD(P)-dependent alcohol dehydrogenase, partial [Deltaproteobacteria bacterium]|nr:NAD(P)-dependent alcohol dehydrogenase [Deltaproteobacteria bacterium]
MKALYYDTYGPPDVLRFDDLPVPEPGSGEVLVRVCATSVNRTDNATIQAIPFLARLVTGVFRPKRRVPGTEFAGLVEKTGP